MLYRDYNSLRGLRVVGEAASTTVYKDPGGINHTVKSYTGIFEECGRVPLLQPTIITAYDALATLTLTDTVDRMPNGVVETKHTQNYSWAPSLRCFQFRRQH